MNSGLEHATAKSSQWGHHIRQDGECTQAAIFERLGADGELYLPHRYRDGRYRVANPALGQSKHHSANQIAIRADEIDGYLRKGFLLRMKGQSSGQVNLISASEIRRRGGS